MNRHKLPISMTPIFLCSLVAVLVFFQGSAYAQSSYNIGVQLSKGCLTLIENHLPTKCPTYDKIKPIDNTDPNIAGKWINTTHGYDRKPPQVLDHYRFNPNHYVVMVDPNPDFTTRANMIYISTDNFTWSSPDEVVNNTNIRTEIVNRYVSANCDSATVAPIIPLIFDTVQYLESGCTKTKFNDKIHYKIKDVPFSFKNPYSSLIELKYRASIFHGHTILTNEKVATGGGLGPGNCISHKCAYKDPNSNW